MGESDTVVSAYTIYRHLQQYCCHPSVCLKFKIPQMDKKEGPENITTVFGVQTHL